MKVTDYERDLVHEIADGNFECIKEIGVIRMLCLSSRDLNYFDVLLWLKRQKITGSLFMEYLRIKHRNSRIHFLSEIRMRIFNDFKKRKIVAR